jgi:hypothetical protein
MKLNEERDNLKKQDDENKANIKNLYFAKEQLERINKEKEEIIKKLNGEE